MTTCKSNSNHVLMKMKITKMTKCATWRGNFGILTLKLC